MKLYVILSNLSSSNLVPSKIVCFVMSRANQNLKASQQNVLENLYPVIKLMIEFIAVNTKKKSTRLTKASGFKFFCIFLYFQLQEPSHEYKNPKKISQISNYFISTLKNELQFHFFSLISVDAKLLIRFLRRTVNKTSLN